MHLKKISQNKASIHFADGTVVYFSYSNAVAAFIPGRGFVQTTRHLSASSDRHISEMYRMDCPTATRSKVNQKEIDELYLPKPAAPTAREMSPEARAGMEQDIARARFQRANS